MDERCLHNRAHDTIKTAALTFGVKFEENTARLRFVSKYLLSTLVDVANIGDLLQVVEEHDARNCANKSVKIIKQRFNVNDPSHSSRQWKITRRVVARRLARLTVIN